MRTAANHHTIDDLHATLQMARALEEHFGDWYRYLGWGGTDEKTPTNLHAHVLRHALTVQQGGAAPAGLTGPGDQHDVTMSDAQACEQIARELGGIEKLASLAYQLQWQARLAGEDC